MNILEIEDLIKGLPDQALMQEAQQPSGRMPQYLVVSEIQRRGDMRKRFQAQQQEKGTVAEQILQGGIASLRPRLLKCRHPWGNRGGLRPQATYGRAASSHGSASHDAPKTAYDGPAGHCSPAPSQGYSCRKLRRWQHRRLYACLRAGSPPAVTRPLVSG